MVRIDRTDRIDRIDMMKALSRALCASLVLACVAGCLPRLNRSAEPREAMPAYVTSVRIDPRTLKPIEVEPPDRKPAVEKPGDGAGAPPAE